MVVLLLPSLPIVRGSYDISPVVLVVAAAVGPSSSSSITLARVSIGLLLLRTTTTLVLVHHCTHNTQTRTHHGIRDREDGDFFGSCCCETQAHSRYRDGEARDDRGNFLFDGFWRTSRRPFSWKARKLLAAAGHGLHALAPRRCACLCASACMAARPASS